MAFFYLREKVMMKLIKGNKGVSLLEVMISIIVLSIGIMGLAPLLVLSMHKNSYSNDITKANALAQKEVELLLGRSDYGVLPFVSTVDSIDGTFALTRLVEDDVTNASIPPGLYKISVSLQWSDMDNQPRSVFCSALKPKL